MCFFQKLDQKPKVIEKKFNAQFKFFDSYTPKTIINGFDFPSTPIIKNTDIHSIEMIQWGLIPHWANNEWNKAFTLNARIETLDDKPAFRKVTHNRCLVITNGFYEWQHQGKIKTKFEIGFNDQVFAFGGIYDTYNNVDAYSIVTTEARCIMREIHNTKLRMPIALKTNEEMKAWLNGENFMGRDDFTAKNLDPLQLNLFQ